MAIHAIIRIDYYGVEVLRMGGIMKINKVAKQLKER